MPKLYAVGQSTLQLTKVNSLTWQMMRLTSHLVLFHKMPAIVQPQQRQDIIDLLLIFKHVIYRTRFRQNQNRQPTTKLITISIILELEQVLSPIKSSSMGLSFEMLSFRLVSRTSFQLSCFSLHTTGRDRNVQFRNIQFRNVQLAMC